MAELTLTRKVADGSAVEAFFGHHAGAHYLVQRTRPELADQADLYGRFLDASKRSTAVHHPELLSPRQLTCAPDGRLWVVSDAITGWTAADLLARKSAVPEGLCIEWGLSVCEALEVMHASGRVHGCLAPRHLHVSGDPNMPEVRLLDTSLLHFRGPRSITPPDGAVVVEAEYLSPERASGSRGTTAGDVWGFGVLMVELLTGHRPFRGRSPDESRRLVLQRNTVKLPPRLGRWQSFIDACLAPRPVDRFGSALEVRQALVALLA